MLTKIGKKKKENSYDYTHIYIYIYIIQMYIISDAIAHHPPTNAQLVPKQHKRVR